MWYKKVFKCRQLVSKIMKMVDQRKKKQKTEKNERDDGKVTVKE